ncbi:MAG TPA: exonuclease subunit SbcD [Chitinophagaceae bacterium]|nr:exonuclease subunit SbcD [Chitinophagaceae bacterium]
MRILHTADWHLGLRLYKREIHEEHQFFFSWLVDLIRERKIDVLLISGDIFDQANPSNDTRRLYYDFLKELIHINCRVIITGGNHDSPGILNAPKEILGLLNIHVIGNIPEDQEQAIIELKNEKGELEAVVCAVPYIREPDIHLLTRDEDFEDKRIQVRTAIRKYYDLMAEACKNYQVPVIAMGHLYAAGSETSDSERLIQMGNQSPVAMEDFSPVFKYVALGHIHRPQFIAGQKHIRYSGSPVPLSFSERSDKKILIELDIEDGKIEQVDHPVPLFRKLIRFTGNFEEIKKQVTAYEEDGPAKAFAELHIMEDSVSPAVYADAARFVGDWQSGHIDILNHRIGSTMATPRITDLIGAETGLKELQPLEVLNKMMEAGNVKPEDQELMRMAFLQLLDMEDEMEEE